MKFLIGKKIEMTQKFLEDGTFIPVTRVSAGPCLILEKKTEKKDGYSAVKLAWQEIDPKKANKPLKGFFKKILAAQKVVATSQPLPIYKYQKEFRIAETDPMFAKLEVGQIVDVSIFENGDIIKVQGTSKGRGFQGVVRRHGFSGGKKSHGHKDQLRMPGSIGDKGAARVYKGKKMAGQMGNQTSTALNLEIVEVKPEQNEIWIKGAVPGARNSLLFFKGMGEFELKKSDPPKVVETPQSPQSPQSPAVEIKEETEK